MKYSFRSFLSVLVLVVIADFGSLAMVFYSLPDPSLLNKGTILRRVLSDGRVFTFATGPKNKRYTPIAKIPEHLQDAVVFLEDGKFYQHHGFDIEEITKALYRSFAEKVRLRGASTLSQQLVKNLYLRPERTFRRKLVEAFITVKLEAELSKTKILEIYLNSIDWGRGLFGIQEASMFYFKKSASDLNLKECVFLAAIIPNPARFGKLDEELLPKRFVMQQMMKVFEFFFKTNRISFEEFQNALEHPFEVVP